MTTQQLVIQNELSSYYIKIADDYRQKYLDTEKAFIQLRETSKTQMVQLEDKLSRVISEEREVYLQRLIERDKEIDAVKQQYHALEQQRLGEG